MNSNDLGSLSPAASAFLTREHSSIIAGRPVGSEGMISASAIVDPSSGATVATVPDASQDTVDHAVKAARSVLADGPWGQMRPSQRAEALFALADAIEANATEISEVEVVNSGRLIGATEGVDVAFSAHVLRYFAGAATKLAGQSRDLSVPYAPSGHFHSYTRLEPVGVVAGIVPWNVPLGIAAWKVGAALAAGCSIILKPAPQTPLTALRLAELATAAGLPEGTLNVVTGPAAGTMLVEHAGVDKISFTGSTRIGRMIGESAGRQLKRHTLELGGKSPVVIMPDANLEAAIPQAAWGIFANQGQNCCAGSRLYVHESIFDRVIEGIAEIAQAIRIGPGLDRMSEMGPLVSSDQRNSVMRFIEGARRAGASVVTGGEAIGDCGYYLQPTILANIANDATAVREEIFGPVLSAMRFSSADDALRLANDNAYGLGASIFTRDLDTAHRFVRGFQAGTVWVNVHNILDAAMPFGGIKSSGVGHDLGEEAVLSNLRSKAVVFHHG